MGATIFFAGNPANQFHMRHDDLDWKSRNHIFERTRVNDLETFFTFRDRLGVSHIVVVPTHDRATLELIEANQEFLENEAYHLAHNHE